MTSCLFRIKTHSRDNDPTGSRSGTAEKELESKRSEAWRRKPYVKITMGRRGKKAMED